MEIKFILDPKDPAMVYKLNDETYDSAKRFLLVHTWGKDFTIWRRLYGFYKSSLNGWFKMLLAYVAFGIIPFVLTKVMIAASDKIINKTLPFEIVFLIYTIVFVIILVAGSEKGILCFNKQKYYKINRDNDNN